MITNEEIERKLNNAIKARTPDIMDDLISELGLENSESRQESKHMSDAQTGERVRVKSKNGVLGRMRLIASCAALLILIAGITALTGRNNEAFAVVGLDVNPSVELSMDKNEKVIYAKAVNEEGRKILADMDLKGTDIDVACNSIVGSMLTQGYLTSTSNSILVSVKSDDEERGRAIEKKLSGQLNTYLENSQLAAAVLGQYVKHDDELEDFAEKNNISEGKAWLIRRLLESGKGSMTEESLLNLSTQELMLLAQDKNIGSESTYGEADTSKYISRDDAADAALRKVGVSSSQATGLHIEFDCERGRLVYEVEFYSGSREYEVDVDAITGEIVSYEAETEDAEKEPHDESDDYDDYDHDDDDHD